MVTYYSNDEANSKAKRIRDRLAEASHAIGMKPSESDADYIRFNKFLSNSVLFARELIITTIDDFQTLRTMVHANDDVLLALSETLATMCANCCFMYCQVLNITIENDPQLLVSDHRRMKETSSTLLEAGKVLQHIMSSDITFEFAREVEVNLEILEQVSHKFQRLKYTSWFS